MEGKLKPVGPRRSTNPTVYGATATAASPKHFVLANGSLAAFDDDSGDFPSIWSLSLSDVESISSINGGIHSDPTANPAHPLNFIVRRASAVATRAVDAITRRRRRHSSSSSSSTMTDTRSRSSSRLATRQFAIRTKAIATSAEPNTEYIFECESTTVCDAWIAALLEEAASRLTFVREDVHAAVSDFYFVEEARIGAGMSGTVQRIARKTDGKLFALKTVPIHGLHSSQLRALSTEIDILKGLDHPHIAKLYETYVEPGVCVRLVLELAHGGELYDRLATTRRFTEKYVAKLTVTMLSCLSYLHENKICHRDLKLENFLFRSDHEDDELLLIDFGLSLRYSAHERITGSVGTSYYVAPEVLEGVYAEDPSDMWSLGVIVYMMLSGVAPFDGRDDTHILRAVAEKKPPDYTRGAWKRLSPASIDFVSSLLTVDPSKRATATSALNHPWLKDAVHSHKEQGGCDLTPEMVANLRRYARMPRLKRLAMETTAYHLDHDEIKNLVAVFEELDPTNSRCGYATFNDLKTALGSNFSVEEAKHIFEALDEEHEGRIHVSEFVAATLRARDFMDDAHLSEAFKRLDVNNSGYISVSNLKKLLGKSVGLDKVRAMLKRAGADEASDMELSFAAFRSFMLEE